LGQNDLKSKLKAELHPLSVDFDEGFFETKFVVYIPQ
jgi:16S rRNA (guanine527-N7)-methyltransferase